MYSATLVESNISELSSLMMQGSQSSIENLPHIEGLARDKSNKKHSMENQKSKVSKPCEMGKLQMDKVSLASVRSSK